MAHDRQPIVTVAHSWLRERRHDPQLRLSRPAPTEHADAYAGPMRPLRTEEPAPLPSLDELLEPMRVVSLPMHTRFRGITRREAALLHGPNGWVEFSPFLEYDTAEAAAWLAGAIDAGWTPQPAPVRDRVSVNATLPAVPAGEVPAVMAHYGDLSALHTVKVKVAGEGDALEDDRARLRALRELVGNDVRVRIDVNGRWGLDEAFAALAQLARFGLEYAEQPVADVEDLARLREQLAAHDVPVPIAADESVRKAEDPLRVAELGAADLIIVKAQPLGGAHRVLDVVARSGLPAVVSSALDTAVGIAAGARLAAALPALDHACGLATGALFTDDVAGRDAHGARTAEDAAGFVHDFAITPGWVEPDEDALDRLDAGVARTGWWRERIAACHAALAERG